MSVLLEILSVHLLGSGSDSSSGCVTAAACFLAACGGAVGAPVVGVVTAESPLVTNRTRGRTLCLGAEASSPALCGSRCEGQNTCEETPAEKAE